MAALLNVSGLNFIEARVKIARALSAAEASRTQKKEIHNKVLGNEDDSFDRSVPSTAGRITRCSNASVKLSDLIRADPSSSRTKTGRVKPYRPQNVVDVEEA